MVVGCRLSVVGCRGVVLLGAPATRFVQRGPTKVGACKSILFNESFHVVKKEHLVDFAATLYFLSLCCNALPSGNVSQSIF